jgi:hypothetical protein
MFGQKGRCFKIKEPLTDAEGMNHARDWANLLLARKSSKIAFYIPE